MQNVLLVEDSKMFANIIKKKVEQSFDTTVYTAKNLAEAEELLTRTGISFSIALLDYNLPDAPSGEVIDKVTKAGISSIVITSNVTEEVRDYVWKKRVADYVVKNDPNSLGYIINVMGKLEDNQNNMVLVVDDSTTFRTALSELLYVRKYRVLNASDAMSGLEILDNYPEIKLVITDYNMPEMNGWQFCQKIREKHKADKVSIIGISSENDRSMGAKFLKGGANDYIMKHSFLVEEFYARVENCIEAVNLFEQIHENGIRDFLTGLHNRRYFFDAGEKLFQQCKQNGNFLACAMIDIDHFKQVNDTFGHDVGDIVIQEVSNTILEFAGEKDIVARFGGEEFCVLALPDDVDSCVARFEALRENLANKLITYPLERIKLHVTVSIGICISQENELEKMVKVADENLYRAKISGRDKVTTSDIQ